VRPRFTVLRVCTGTALAVALWLGTAALAGAADEPGPPPTDPTARQEWLRNLPPAQRRAVRERERRLRDMPAEERTRLRKRYERLQKMPAEERKRVEENRERWEDLGPEEKRRIRKRYERLQKMPPERRENVRKRSRRSRQQDSTDAAREPELTPDSTEPDSPQRRDYRGRERNRRGY